MSVTAEELENLKVGDRVYLKPYHEVKEFTTLTEKLYSSFVGIPLSVWEIEDDEMCLVHDKFTKRCIYIMKYCIKNISVYHEPESSSVHHPNHYNQNGMEVWDVIKAFTSNLSGSEAFYAGNAIKYILRWDKKNGIEDLEKAKVYIDKIIEGRKGDDKASD